MKESEDLRSSYIANCVLNAFLSYTAIMLNSVTIYALRKTLSLPKPLKVLLLSMAISDLAVGVLVQPLFIAYLVTKLEQNTGNRSSFTTTYIVFSTAVYLFGLASLFSVMALIADRFLGVHLHLRYQELVTHKRVVAVVISIWIFSAFCSLIRLWIPVDLDISDVITSIAVAAFVLTSALLNYKRYVAVRHHANQIHAQQVQQEKQNGEGLNSARLRNYAMGTFLVYLTFLLCYFPRICTIVYKKIGTSTTIERWQLYTLTLVFVNSSLNPLIYCWKMRHIRRTVMEIIRNILRNL